MKKGARHLVVAGVIVALVVSPAGAGGSRRHVVERPYRTPVPGAALGGDYQAYYYDCQNQIGCAVLPTKGLRFAKVEVDDAAGQNVFFSVNTMPGGNHLGDYCGSTGDWIATDGAHELLVHIVAGVCKDGSTPSVATTGIVRATFSRRG